jgi:tRNA nucleotidyltransferase (CCA-adding enzyme)
MPMTVTQGFQKLKENLEITTLQEKTTSERQQNIRDALKTDLNVLDSFLAGSYRRNTMIAPLSEADIDIFIILGPEYFEQNGQAMLLDKVKLSCPDGHP